ncbi:hypothetical protein WOLCODRAFT_21518 [Wolfiporia cocos MD-104 SS10]|uniref:F-box domain-containing protein n=1 Tax=Wolfiporia cocos (strain MD-104) TaxID=742152 RepID=A0A2H3JBJ2_WOLCO|nr:hypothetical protein WOLCODRAFT_21518 [Wolfiporia cocos MD-104 SS10]
MDNLKDEPKVIQSCILVCRAFCVLSKHLLKISPEQTLGTREQTWLLGKFVRAMPVKGGSTVKSVEILGNPRSRDPKSVGHLGTFAAMFGGKLHQLESLSVKDATLADGDCYRSLYMNLSVFPSIIRLEIGNVTFPSISVLARLIIALPNVKEIIVSANIAFTKTRLPFLKGFSSDSGPNPGRSPNHLTCLLYSILLGANRKSMTLKFTHNARIDDVEPYKLLKSNGGDLRGVWKRGLRCSQADLDREASHFST